MSRHKRSWKNVLVDPKYQLKFVAWFTVHGVVLGTFYTALITFLVRSTFTKLITVAGVDPARRGALMATFDSVLLQAAGATGLFIVLCAVSGLMFSHRSAGPLYRFKRLFAQVRDGDFSARCHLRKSDHYRDAADLFNQMMNTVEERAKDRAS